ncbi:MAG: hypothetical protein GQ477_01985 [Nanohaloarchaea archaeon]|nr:hypothetical protein [Candidatus Nanohaloarchaea archaeon]
MLLQCRRKGQLNIDYIFAFFVLALSVVYAANIAMGSIGPFYDTIDNNNLHAEAWFFSEVFLRDIQIKDYVLNESLIDIYAGNRTKLRDSIDEKYRYRQKIIIEQYPIIFTEDILGNNHFGTAVFNKDYSDELTVNFTVQNSSISGYDVVDVWADSFYSDRVKDNIILINGVNYTISIIDSDGNFVGLKRTALSYGWGSINRDMVAVNRYSTLDGFMAKINIMYF